MNYLNLGKHVRHHRIKKSSHSFQFYNNVSSIDKRNKTELEIEALKELKMLNEKVSLNKMNEYTFFSKCTKNCT